MIVRKERPHPDAQLRFTDRDGLWLTAFVTNTRRDSGYGSADRGFFSHALWRNVTATGADLLWRIRTDKASPKPVHVEDLPDGSWLANPRQTHSAAARRAEPMRVRVIDYTLDDGRENPASYRLFTTLPDPAQSSATDLAVAYSQRWEIELAFDELKTHQRRPRTVRRSKPP